MYARLDNGWIKPELIIGVEQFVEFTKMHPECMDGEKIKCPCTLQEISKLEMAKSVSNSVAICK